MDSQTVSYKCLSCGSPLAYNESGKLKCSACGTEYDLETLKKFYESGDGDAEFDWKNYKEKFEEGRETLENTVIYICRSCGAEIETNPQTAATHCPYCDNEVILSDRVGNGLKPNGIIPFKIDKSKLSESIANYIKGKKLLPNNFIPTHKIGKIQGVYVPFWLFDATLDGQMVLEASKTRCYSTAKYEVTEVSHYLIDIDGQMAFSKVPVDASVRMDDDLMDSLEPFDYSEMVDFEAPYLSGFLADRFDEDPDKSLPRASSRMTNSAEQVFTSSVDSGYESIRRKSSNMGIIDSSLKYVMLPVYLLNVSYNGKNYRFAINGQTGKVVGELPISKVKKWLYTLLFFSLSMGVYTAIAWLISRFL